uniref:Integrator complex subunit 2 n=1 Tax=Wuchereria bancrofti TaxID=6293 RepID=A0A1I8EC97_WUCBA
MVPSQIPQPVYAALKNGTFIDNIDAFDLEQIQPFLPSLLLCSFSSACVFSDESLDQLRRRLLEFPQCNSLFQILSADVMAVENDLNKATVEDIDSIRKIPFETAPPQMKLKIVAFLLDQIVRNMDNGTNLDIFEQESTLEEVVCAMTVCALYMPDRFDPALIIHPLLTIPNAVTVITMLICNVSDSLESTVDYLLRVQLLDDDNVISKNRNNLLLKLLSIDPCLVEPSISQLLDANTSNGNSLALMLICVCLSSAQLINNLLCALLNKRSLAAFIHRSSDKPAVKLLRDRISEAISAFSSSTMNDGTEATLAQLLAVLRINAGMRLSYDETNLWLLFLTRTDLDDDRYIMTALSVIIACPQLIPLHLGDEKEVETSIIAFLNWLKQRASSSASPTLQQFFILLSIHLHAAQTEQLAVLISSVLAFKVTVNVRNLITLKNLFLRHAMTERDIAERASQMPVTRFLSSHHQGFLPAHCITQLLSTNSFSKYSVPIQDWIGAQITNCATPLHPVVTDLLNAYAASCFAATEFTSANRPLSEDFILNLFNGEVMDESKMVPRLLTFFFLLCYRKSFESHAQKRTVQYFYSTKVEGVIPVRFLLNVVETRPEQFRAIRSPLVYLCGLYYPYMLPTVDSLLLSVDDELKNPEIKTIARRVPLSTGLLLKAFNRIDENPSNSMRFIRLLQKSTLREQVQAMDAIIHAMVIALNPCTPVAFANGAVAIWKRLENVVPRSLCEATVFAWSTEELNHDTLVEQPLFLFRCDERLFENDILFPCYLRILSFYLSASRTYLLQKLQINQIGRDDQHVEREELARSLIGAQDSAVVQILLEICGRFKNIVVHRLCCAHIHQMFIADPVLSKLVHFQGYPLRLIPLAVREIPSMHICLEFVHEILALADISKRVFAIVLIAELAQQYKIESSFIRVELLLDVLTTLSRALTTDENLRLLSRAVPSLGRMMSLFPQISADVAHLLIRISSIAASRMAVSATVLKTELCMERRLIMLVNNILCEAVSDVPALPV